MQESSNSPRSSITSGKGPPKFNLSSQAHSYDRTSLPTTYIWTREYSDGQVLASNPVHLQPPAQHHSVLERAFHTVAMRIRRSYSQATTMGLVKSDESLRLRQCEDDERAVRQGTCNFQVKYIGSIEVLDSKGIIVCEDAINALKQESRKTRKNSDPLTGQHHWATLHITTETITVVDDETQNVLAEDRIESISYCAAHRQLSKYFAYISRNGSSPSDHGWTCHVVAAVTAPGDRISHAVGCAFAACHEKQNPDDADSIELANVHVDISPDNAHGTTAVAQP